MWSRNVWPCLAALLALIAPVGCSVLPSGGWRGQATPPPTVKGEARELPPERVAPLCLTTAEKLYASGEVVQAAALYEKARASGCKDPRISRRLGVLYGQAGNVARSRAEFDQASAATPSDPNLHNDMGYLAYSRGQLDEAEKHLRRAIELDGRCRRAWVNLGLVLGTRKRYSEALEAFLQAMPEAQAHSNMAFIYTTHGKQAEARQAYRLALKMDPDMPVARAALAKLERAAPPRQQPEIQQAAYLGLPKASSLGGGLEMPAPPRKPEAAAPGRLAPDMLEPAKKADQAPPAPLPELGNDRSRARPMPSPLSMPPLTTPGGTTTAWLAH